MKNQAYLLASLVALSLPVFAAEHAEHEEDDFVNVPVYISSYEDDFWTIGASALFVQPSSSNDLVYATVEVKEPNNIDNKSISRDYDWGFDAFLQYTFGESDRDLMLVYMHFSNSDKSNTNLGEFSPNYQYNNFYHTAQGYVATDINMIDLLAGQTIMMGEDLSVHFQAGVTYAWLKQNFDTTYDAGLGHSDIPPFAQEAYNTESSKFQGVGPKLGIDADYGFEETDFGLVGGISAALLVGSQDYSTSSKDATYIIPAPPTPPPPPTYAYSNTDYDSVTTTVTNINANLGIRYQFGFEEDEELPFDVELGYRVYEFIDVLHNDNDISLTGPYLELAGSF